MVAALDASCGAPRLRGRPPPTAPGCQRCRSASGVGSPPPLPTLLPTSHPTVHLPLTLRHSALRQRTTPSARSCLASSECQPRAVRTVAATPPPRSPATRGARLNGGAGGRRDRQRAGAGARPVRIPRGLRRGGGGRRAAPGRPSGPAGASVRGRDVMAPARPGVARVLPRVRRRAHGALSARAAPPQGCCIDAAFDLALSINTQAGLPTAPPSHPAARVGAG